MIRVSERINLHPPRAQLGKFVAGELSVGLSTVMAAHLEYCAECQQARAILEANLAADWQATDADAAAVDEAIFSAILDRIVEQPQQASIAPPESVSHEVVIDNKAVSLPRVLAKIAATGLNWKQLPGGISQALVELDDRTKCEFIYMPPGSKAPAHTHRGNEVMLVLDGVFSDELGNYKVADFVMRDPSHKHQPRTQDGCLCFSVLDSPLVFTEGWLRLLNPFNRLMFSQGKWSSH